MLSENSNPYVYFMFSSEQINKKNEIEGNLGRRFECGNVIVNGKQKKFSYMGTDKAFFVKQYPDAKLIAEGYKNQMNYTDTYTTAKRGN